MTTTEYLAARDAVVDRIGEREFRRRQTEALKCRGSVGSISDMMKLMNQIDRRIVAEAK